MKAFIRGISYYLPETVCTNERLVAEFPEWDAEKVFNKVGVRERHLAGTDETAGDLAEKAARKLFEEYGVSPSEIDFILLCTQSPDYRLPSTACVLQDRLGIPTSAGALDFDLGCSGCIYGMALAKGLIAGGIARNVLLLTAETYSKYLHPEDKSNRTIFGDGAAACLVSKDGGFAEIGEFVLGTDGSGAENLIIKTLGARHPQASGLSSVDDDGHVNREDYLYMNGSAIFNFTLETVPRIMKELLDKSELGKDDVGYFVFHQANRFMLSTLRKVCGIPKDRFHIDLEHCGNTVSPTILIGLKDSLERETIQPGMTVMVCGFGVGLSYGASLLQF